MIIDLGTVVPSCRNTVRMDVHKSFSRDRPRILEYVKTIFPKTQDIMFGEIVDDRSSLVVGIERVVSTKNDRQPSTKTARKTMFVNNRFVGGRNNRKFVNFLFDAVETNIRDNINDVYVTGCELFEEYPAIKEILQTFTTRENYLRRIKKFIPVLRSYADKSDETFVSSGIAAACLAAYC